MIVLYKKETIQVDNSVAECFIMETEKDFMSWGMAFKSHIRHYFPIVDEDDDVDNNGTVKPPPLIRGNGKKQGRGLVRTWKQRYFVLDSGILNYYESPIDIYPFGMDKRGDITLTSFTVELTHNVRKNSQHHSETASSPSETTAITFSSSKTKEHFVIILDNISMNYDGKYTNNADVWYNHICAHIEYARLMNLS